MVYRERELCFLIFFAGTALLSLMVTIWIKKIASGLGIHDLPDNLRKIHKKPLPKLGGAAIFLSFLVGVVILSILGGTDDISPVRILGFIIGGLILIIGGILDDRYNLKASRQIIFPIAAAAIVVLSGTHISYVTNPFGGKLILDQYKILAYPVLGSILVFAWILGMTYTTKFLDGMDGLVAGISAIAGLIIFALSLGPQVNQTTTAFFAIIFAGACAGFLPQNFHPAKIFLGEGGSTFTGFMIAVLSVISGGKIATALLVLGIPVLDAAWVIVRRIWFGASPFVGDKKHLHFRLLDIGLSQKQAVIFLYILSAIFGGVAVFLQSLGKLVALLILGCVMLLLAMWVVIIYKRKNDAA